jgi:dipeptidyl-peptidase-4
VRVPTPRGHALNAMLLRPQDGRGHEKRPVMVFTYAGPHGPSVSNEWSGTGGMLKQLLATEGYLVWTVDPYSASGEGEISAWHAYGRLGVTELEDLEDSLRWLADHADADLTRVGIFGHSYGGYMVAYALTHSEMFKVGIAAAPLSDWRNYDTIYAEPFMRTPANNPEGYQQSSVLAAAHQLHGRLLLVHGGDDDNVHLQNTMQLIHRLQEAGRRFDVMIYPQDGHGLYGNGDHWRRLRYDYIRENL